MPSKKSSITAAAPKLVAKSGTQKVKAAAKALARPSKAAPKKSKAPKLRDIFERAGFKHIEADGCHFTIEHRQGEIDHIFVWENVILLCEETAAKDVSAHFSKKALLHRIIKENYSDFFQIYRELNPALDSYIGTTYNSGELEVRHLYYSEEQPLDVGLVAAPGPFRVLSIADAAYFASLTRTISKSARYELLKYLGISLSRVGEARLSGGGTVFNSFSGIALPATHTNYPKGFAVVSFYADPKSLMERAYVFRRDGWEDPNLSYQRFIKAEKLAKMREYLASDKMVFINNLIVTLPAKALLRDHTGQIIDPATFIQKTNVELQLPLELGTVGVVDGQHRILSYFEGDGQVEAAIAPLRKRQNLLVTGIVFPSDYTKERRAKFEAELFLTINNTQTGVNTQLRQDLETIIKPETPLAIARAIVNRLASEGPLAGMIQVSQFDPPDRIASGSLGPYVLKHLVCKGGALHRLWDSHENRDLAEPDERRQYIDFCFGEIKRLLNGAKQNLQGRWMPVAQGGLLSTTVVGGLILLLGRLVVKHGGSSQLDYSDLLKPVSTFDFKSYKSSHWTKMSVALDSTLGEP